MSSQMNLTPHMHMRPDLWGVLRTASPATIPPSPDLYDVRESLGPSYGPPPARKMSSFNVDISQLRYPSVAMTMSTGVTTSQ
jgi:hypothetical protein